MPRILRTPTSRRDVVEILLYLRGRSPQGARAVRVAINTTFRFLSENPMAGQSRHDLAKNLGSYPVRSYRHYLIFYRPLIDGIQVMRVLHGARKLPRRF